MTILQIRQYILSCLVVIVEHIPFRKPFLMPVKLTQVCKFQLMPVHFFYLSFLFWIKQGFDCFVAGRFDQGRFPLRCFLTAFRISPTPAFSTFLCFAAFLRFAAFLPYLFRIDLLFRSEERRVGKECVCPYSSGWS